MSRGNYVWEIRAAMLMPAAIACVEGNVVGVIASKAFIDPTMPAWTGFAVAALASAGPVGLLTSALWSRLFHGRDRVRCTNMLQVGVAACVLAIAMLPLSLAGLIGLVAITLLARILVTGILNARSDIWRANYPRTQRGFAVGRIAVVTATVMGATGMIVALVMDAPALHDQGFRIVFAVCAGCALLGAWSFSHVRWRGRGEHLARERDDSEGAPGAPSPRAMLRVLRDDHGYRRFMIAQFLLGAPNLAATPLFILALRDHFDFGYTPSIALAHVIPVVLATVSIPMWSRLLDRVHIVHFRAYHSWTFVAANALMGVGFLTENMPILVASRLVLGLGIGGGMLAWELGHHDFASRQMANLYMGIHATLTGIRGLIAPFLFTYIYLQLGAAQDTTRLGTILPGLELWTFFLLAAIGVFAAMQFVRMHRELRAAPEASARGA
jgi:hypothetical protein